MKRKKILALTLAAAMSLALFSGCSRPSASSGGNDNPSANNTGSTSSEEPIVIKIGHTDSDTRSTHKWSVWLGEWLEEQAPGRFKVEVYPNGQLGDSPDMVAGVKLGTLTMEFDLSSVVSSVSGPATSAVDLPRGAERSGHQDLGRYGRQSYPHVLERSADLPLHRHHRGT